MKKKIITVAISVMGLITLFSTSDVFAYPWFARRLVDNCTKCHSAFPKNNDYGWYVKSSGYELPDISYEGLDESPFMRMFRYLPVAVRLELDVINSKPSDMEGDLNVRELQLISGGSIFNNKVSWWFHKHFVESNKVVSLFSGLPHEMWGQYNLRFGKSDATRVNLRYGMSELPLRFAPSKTNLVETLYAIYNARLGENNFTMSLPQYGVYINATRMGGENINEVKYSLSLGLVNGKADFSTHKFTEVFGRAATTFSKTMVGAFAYVGANDIPMVMDEHGEQHAGEQAEKVMTTGNNFYRFGLDIDSNITSKINLFALALYGRDSNPLGLAASTSGNFYGGFVGLDYSLTERLMFSTRFDLVRFSDLPAAEEHHEEPGGEMNMGEGEHTEGGGGHMHGEAITSNTDAMVFGVNFLPISKILSTPPVGRISGSIQRPERPVSCRFAVCLITMS